jgi:hypothetical protein
MKGQMRYEKREALSVVRPCFSCAYLGVLLCRLGEE